MKPMLFKAGDRVKFSRDFLWRIGANPLSSWHKARGTVESVSILETGRQHVRVQWDDPEGELNGALNVNLALVKGSE